MTDTFNFRDTVKVEDGFYEGATGDVREVNDYSGNDIDLLETKVYTVKVVSYIQVNEKDLSLVSKFVPTGENK